MPVSVVIMAFNEGENLAPLVEEVAGALGAEADWEAIVVDDGSRDDTAERLAALREHIPQLVVARHRSNHGQSAALVTGVRHARGEVVVTLDGDGQNDPADIPALLARFRAEGEAALVAGERRDRHDSPLRRISSRIANAVRSTLLDDRCRDTGCGLKVFSRERFLALPHFDHMHRFLPALFARGGGYVCNVPVRHRPRRAGVSKYGVHNRLWVGIVDLVGVMWLMRRRCAPEVERVGD